MIKRIGVTLKEGCNIEGADLAIKSLADMLDFDEIISIDPSQIRNEKPLFLNAVSELNGRLKQCVHTLYELGDFPLVFGGDHALAIRSIAGSLTPETGVLWIDAHGDCNTVISSPSQHIHGMPLAVLQGHGHPQLTLLNNTIIKAKDILQVGIRSLDEQEAIQMQEWGVHTITMKDINTHGFDWMIKEVQLFIADHPKIHISFDCDSIDPCDALASIRQLKMDYILRKAWLY